MKAIKLVYFGTPNFSGEILEALIKDKNVNVVAVITQPDKPKGRKNLVSPTPVAEAAEKHNIPTFKPKNLNQSNLQHIKLLNANIFLVAAYGQIIPKSWLDTPKMATLNIHFSLLPKYRGALCVSESIKNQDQETGVTLMVMDQKLDHGPIVSQSKTSINLNDDVSSLTQKLTQKAIQLLSHTKFDSLEPKPQDHTKATYTPSLKTRTRQSAFIKTLETKNPKKLHALIRSLNPDPGAWTKIKEKEIKIIETKLENDKFKILKVQLPGKNSISYQQFLNQLPQS